MTMHRTNLFLALFLAVSHCSEQCDHETCPESSNNPKDAFHDISNLLLKQLESQQRFLEDPQECPLGLWHEGKFISGEQLEQIREQQMNFGRKFLRGISKLKPTDFAIPRFAKVYLDWVKKQLKSKDIK